MLKLQKVGAFVVSPGDQGGAMTNGANQSGEITIGDLDRWTFTANAGDYIAVNAGLVTGDKLQSMDPSGFADSRDNRQHLEYDGRGVSVQATVTGTYTVAIGTANFGNAGTGTYTLTVAEAPGTFVVSPGDDGGTITNGNVNGTLTVGDLDMFSFGANSGASLHVAITLLTGTNFNPWIRLMPNGAVVGNTWGTTGATINVTAPQAGTYTVIVATANFGNAGTGTYQLTLSGANLAPRPGDRPKPLAEGALPVW